MTPLLFSSFLSFPFLLPLQEQSPSRSIPSLALELNAQHDAGENISELLNSSWESSNIQDKVSLLHASSRAFPNTPEHAKLLERCLLHSDPQLQKEAALLSGFLSPNFVPAYALADLLVSTTDKGVFSAATQTSWASGLYARPSFPPPTKESILVLRTQIQEGKPPLHGVAWILQNQKGLRTDYLNSLLAKALPETELASLLEVTIESWAPLDRFLFQALLLDQGLEKEKAAHWTASWWQHLAPSESTNPSHQALWAALGRHTWALNAQALDLGPNRTIDSEGTRFLIHQAPSSISNSTLFKWAQDTELDSSLRTQCILKLLRSEGNIWAPRLLSLLQESQDEAILNALSIGMVPWVSQEVLEAFRKRIVHIPPQAAGYAALILCKHGTHEERMRFLPKLPSLQSTATAFLVAEAAWKVEPTEDLLSIYKEYTKGSGPKSQFLGRRILSTVLSPKGVAEFYESRLKEEQYPHVRDHLLSNLIALGSDEALLVFVDWLQTPDALSHPKVVDWAGLLLTEEKAKPLFRSWWALKDSLPLSLQDITAAALISMEQSARRHIYHRFSDFSPNFQVVAATLLAKSPQPSEFETWADWLRAPKPNQGLARLIAKSLAEALPQSQEVCVGLLQDFEDQRLSPTSSAFLVTQLLSHDTGILRDECLRISHQQESNRDAEVLTKARLRGQAANPLPKDLPLLLEECLSLLNNPAPRPLPGNTAFSIARLRTQESTFLHSLNALAQHNKWADDALASALEANSGQHNYHPDRLWVLATHDATLPKSAALSKQILSVTEPLSSNRRVEKQSSTSISPLFWTNSGLVLDKIQTRLMLHDDSSELFSLVQRALFRWKQDRRFHSYLGWSLIASGKYSEAISAFQNSIQRSGAIDAVQREPRIGIAVCNQLLQPESISLEAYLQKDPDAAAILPARLSSRNPALSHLLEKYAP